MNDLLFIRHAETDMAGTFCGRSDPPVNAAGELQIAKLLSELRGESISTVFTSDLRRAATTASAIAEEFGVARAERAGLREIGFGAWEGLTWKEIEAMDAGYAREWLEAFPKLPAPQGESLEAFDERVMAEAAFFRQRCEEGTIVVVTHAGVMRTLLRMLCGLDEASAWAMTKDYCCMFRCDRTGRVLEEAIR